MAYVLINGTGLSSQSFRYGEWEPPAWSLNDSEESFEETIDSLILESRKLIQSLAHFRAVSSGPVRLEFCGMLGSIFQAVINCTGCIIVILNILIR